MDAHVLLRTTEPQLSGSSGSQRLSQIPIRTDSWAAMMSRSRKKDQVKPLPSLIQTVPSEKVPIPSASSLLVATQQPGGPEAARTDTIEQELQALRQGQRRERKEEEKTRETRIHCVSGVHECAAVLPLPV